MIEAPPLTPRQGFVARLRRWALWQLPPAALALVLAVEAGAIALTAWSLWAEPSTITERWRVLAIALVAVGYGELCDRIERLRRYVGDGKLHTNHLSVWTVAAMLVAPAGVACLLVVLLYGHTLLMARRHQSVRPHRSIFTGAAAVCGTWVGSEIPEKLFGGEVPARSALPALSCLMAIVLMLAVNTALVAAVMRLTTDRRGPRELLPAREALLFELGTEGLGVIGAELLLNSAWLAPATVGLLFALHRASLVNQLLLASSTDPKTGLLTVGTWRERAAAAVRRAAADRRRVALIAIDLDHFKRVNDDHGHLIGDKVLRAVGGVLRRHAHPSDLVGRFGGEEFFILVSGPTAAAHAVDLATRLRSAIAALELPLGLQVTASLGIAHQVPVTGSLDALVAAADAALYEAKARGRDRVHAALI